MSFVACGVEGVGEDVLVFVVCIVVSMSVSAMLPCERTVCENVVNAPDGTETLSALASAKTECVGTSADFDCSCSSLEGSVI